jgi:general stress protein 26
MQQSLRSKEPTMDAKIRTAFWKELAHSPFLMVRLAGAGNSGQPMTAMLDADAHGKIWFFMNRTNTLAPGGTARADLSAKGHGLFAAIAGTLHEETDHAVRDKLWSNQVAAWFKEGKDSPAVLLMRFDIDEAEVWQADMSIAGLLHLFTGTLIEPEQAGHHATGPV